MVTPREDLGMYKGQINRGLGWVTIAESNNYQSAKNMAWDYAIEHDCDWRVKKD